MAMLMQRVIMLGLIILSMCPGIDSAQKSCAHKGCSYDGNIKPGDTDPGNGAKCSCIALCVSLSTCCEDYFEVCAHLHSTTITQTTTEDKTTTTESVQTTTEEETTQTRSVQTTTQEETTTTESIQTSTQEETTTTESVQTSTQEETTTTEFVQTTTQEETTKTEGVQSTTQDCGPFPTWLDIRKLNTDEQTVQYTCREGYSFSDDSEPKTSTCNSHGDWEPDFEQCEEISDATAEALYWKPTEAAGAYYIGTFALFIIVAKIIFIVTVDLSTFKKSFRICVRSIRGKQRKNSEDPEALDTDESPQASGATSSLFFTTEHKPSRSSLQVKGIELTNLDTQQHVAGENMLAW